MVSSRRLHGKTLAVMPSATTPAEIGSETENPTPMICYNGFVGDSLNWNMFVSLFCMLRRVSEGEVRKGRPAGADRGIIFVNYNLTVAYHRTNLPARYEVFELHMEELRRKQDEISKKDGEIKVLEAIIQTLSRNGPSASC